jgi:hypothetical protein
MDQEDHMIKLLTLAGHYIIGLAGIGAMSALAATGTVSGDIAIPVITGITSALVGGGIANASAPTTKTP